MAGFLNPYSTLGELDLHLIAQGRHEQLWNALGAHVRRDSDGALLGTTFSVWGHPIHTYLSIQLAQLVRLPISAR